MDLPSVLGGLAQGFKDFGTSVVDLFGTGGAAIGDLLQGTGTRNQDDFRKWLYNTNSVQDAAAKGLGTALNGVQTVSDYIPGIGAVTRNPLFNAAQGALGGLADEFKMNGENYDLGRAGQRAAVSGAAALAGSSLGDALKKSANPLLQSGLAQGLARGAAGGAINQGGYAAIDGGDVWNSALQGAGMGALLGGATGAMQDFRPRKLTPAEMALTDEERRLRIANIDDQLAKLDTSTQAGIDRHNELMTQRIKYELPQDYMMSHRPTKSGIYADDLLAEGVDGMSYPKDVYDRPQNYTFMYTDTPAVMNETMAQLNAVRGNPNGEITIYRATPGDTINDGDWITLSKTYADLHNQSQLDGKGNVLSQKVNARDVQSAMDDLAEWGYFPQKKTLDTTLADADMAVNSPKLTPEQEAYFKDSVIRDENGNLKPMYHGSPDGTFTVFKDGSFFTDDKDYADVYQDDSAGMATGKKTINPKTYEVYLDVKKPFTMADPEARRIINDEYIGRDKNYWVGPTNETEVDFTEADNLRNWLKKNHPEYDGLYVNEGGGDDPFAEDGWEEWRGNSIVPFNSNQIKDINNLKPTLSDDIMAERVPLESVLSSGDRAINNVQASKIAPGQLGLFDDLPTQTPKTGTRQVSIFDQPQEGLDYYGGDIEAPVIESTNPYAPVNGQVTQAMKDRYKELMSDANQFKYVGADNDLYNKINPDTLPKGYKELQRLLDTQDTPMNSVDLVLKDKIGTDRVWEADTDKLLDYVWGGDNHEKKMYYKTLDDEIAKAKKKAAALGLDDYNAEEEMTKIKREELQMKAYEKAELEAFNPIIQTADADDIMYALSNYRRRGIRTGEPGALDTALSERLGIAPGNTIKITKNVGDDLPRGALGRYARGPNDIAMAEINTPEGKISTMAHERLHSFQNEARLENSGRYSKEVADAYKELQKDLAHHYKSNAEIKKRYKKDVDYWAKTGEQESRMFQQYLENKGYTDDHAWRKLSGKADEWGNEINPAFDKFIDKLRDLSKRGVALPALAGLFGGGVVLDQVLNSKDSDKDSDKDKKKTKRSA